MHNIYKREYKDKPHLIGVISWTLYSVKKQNKTNLTSDVLCIYELYLLCSL